MRRTLPIVLKLCAALAVTLATLWAALAAYWSDVESAAGRTLLAMAVVAGTGLCFALIRRRGRALAAWLCGFALFAAWWSAIAPSNQRDWQPDVAVLPYAQVQGDLVTVRNIRNVAYRTETDYQPRYHDKTFDLKKLEGVDLIAVYWMGDAIAHVMVSFVFQGQDALCFSIETRKEKGEGYSALKGFFKQYELTYVAAEERDLIRLRTDHRVPPEDVYLFRTRMPEANARKLFLEYVKKINSLYETPEYYNTLTTNCTTNVVRHVRAFEGRLRYSWKILFSGYAPQYVYELGGLEDSLPFEELKAKSYVNPKARAAGDAPDFSARIRSGLPGMPGP
ncbi:hypothetical protein NNJEOMEG_03845 [Fundidesulfovibrio magnetotacticus]|uniref:Lnb N-terminal periplasmic domain-containing protein n=1 Tax=Fundidesulfovibrio magnetotacticus TaxID=2730080 RepID=A0A6V8LU23_9BACT|nr:DUF4105 domain-containing protein [Fundidesulfovibrio magnetotacticus]GFK95972.1 hypothetical protein NNJEOMEG_03845 [Fundidesulfovibrio magnetotacticus]